MIVKLKKYTTLTHSSGIHQRNFLIKNICMKIMKMYYDIEAIIALKFNEKQLKSANKTIKK